MAKEKISEQILIELRKECGQEKVLYKFLEELIFFETSGTFQFKNEYNKLIDKHIKEWIKSNEN